MAYAAVASLSQTINLILNYHQDSISPKFKNQITSIREHIIFLRSFLEEFPDEANALEERMRESANIAEDVIELLLSDSTVGPSKSVKTGKHELRYDFDELERVTEEIESIAREVKERHREAVNGVDADVMEIISRLRGGSSGLEIVPIVGTGGIGKTTLARNVYDHPLIMEHFDIRAWATVSVDYSWWGIILGLLSSMTETNAKSISDSDDKLFRSVYHLLWGKRYLIVLDDLWSVEVWEKLESKIPHNFNGSRILITTRLLDVANGIKSNRHIHEMCLMNVDQSWNLLREKTFKGLPCPSKLECMGKMIARSCRGLPLTIEVVSGMLAAHQTRAAWEEIEENMKAATDSEDDDEEHLLRILHLCYTYLPHHLRPCLLYLGIFPEDHKIRVSKLIKLWVAEGFVNESGSKSFEETAEEYLENLVKRSLVSVAKRRKSNGRIKSLSIHDRIRDFCTRQAHTDNFFVHVRRPLNQAMQLERRVSISNSELGNVYGSTIRTIIGLEGSRQRIQCTLRHLRLLRVFDISFSYHFFNLHYVPEEVFELFQLRYLAFNHEFRIPGAISNFQNLQTLIMRPRTYCRGFVELPVEIWRMRQLRHLIVHSCVLPSQEKEAMFALEDLQTLTEVVDFICSKQTMEMIPNLKKLGIFSTLSTDYQLHHLTYLQNLETLKIETHNLVEKQRRISPFSHPTLKKLSLCGLLLPWEDMKIVGSLPNLQVLKLRNHACIGRMWETNEGGFSRLIFLLIDGLNVEDWITKSSHFPRLKWLRLHNCESLRKVPNGIGEIPTLELIVVDHQNKSLMHSAQQIREDRQRLGNHTLQVRLL